MSIDEFLALLWWWFAPAPVTACPTFFDGPVAPSCERGESPHPQP